MRKTTPKLPLIARGALFHWVLLCITGYAAVDGNVRFTLVDAWTGRFKMNSGEQKQIIKEVVEVLPRALYTFSEFKAWLAAGARRSTHFEITSDMLRTALTPNYRARLWLYLNGAAKTNSGAAEYAMKHWQRDASTTHEYYARALDDVLAKMYTTEFAKENTKLIETMYGRHDGVQGLNQTAVAKAFLAAMYIDKRVKSFEQLIIDKKIHAIEGAKRNKDKPLFGNGFYSAMQEAHFDTHGGIVFDTMPQLVAAAFFDRCQ